MPGVDYDQVQVSLWDVVAATAKQVGLSPEQLGMTLPKSERVRRLVLADAERVLNGER
jgi:hypothetical protein